MKHKRIGQTELNLPVYQDSVNLVTLAQSLVYTSTSQQCSEQVSCYNTLHCQHTTHYTYNSIHANAQARQ